MRRECLRAAAALVFLNIAAISATAQVPQRTGYGWKTWDQWNDANSDGFIQSSDTFRFTTSPTSGDFGAPIGLADPTLAYIREAAPGEPGDFGWYYITGTDLDQHNGNFRIFRTKDFRSFEFVKYAFDNSASLQKGRVNRIGGGAGLYGDLVSPQLVQDPRDRSKIYLVFSATFASLNNANDTFSYANVTPWHHWDPGRSIHWNGSSYVSTDMVNPIFPVDDWFQTQLTSAGLTNMEDIWTKDTETLLGEGKSSAQAQWVEAIRFQSTRYLSAYVCQLSISDFLDPDEHFTNPAWFGYTADNGVPNPSTNPLKYDGGRSVTGSSTRQVPCTLSAYFVGIDDDYQCGIPAYWYCAGGGTLSHSAWNDPPDTCSYSDLVLKSTSTPCTGSTVATISQGNTTPFGLFHRQNTDDSNSSIHGTNDVRSVATGMLDAQIYFDATNSHQPWVIYGWRDVGSTGTLAQRGNHVAAAKLNTDRIYQTSASEDLVRVHHAYNTSTATKIPEVLGADVCGQATNVSYNNGEVGYYGNPDYSGWRVAETATMLYEDYGTYQALYGFVSRNLYDSPAYCIAYRTVFDDSLPSALSLPSTYPENVQEYLLASAKQYVNSTTTVDHRGNYLFRSYGTGEVAFAKDGLGEDVVDPDGFRIPIMAYSVKCDGGSNYRTLFFKRITRSATGTPPLNEWIEGHPSAWINTWKSDLPLLGCPGDVNNDGVVDLSDYFDFLNDFNSTPPGSMADINRDGVVDLEDYFILFGTQDSGCY